MDKRTYAITGATGHIGHLIVAKLLQQGHAVRALSRDPNHVQPPVDIGAEPYVGPPDDVELMKNAFRDADAVFLIIPPHLQAPNLREFQNQVGQAQAEALQKAGVQYAVNLSSLGAEHAENVGPIRGLHDQEERLNSLTGIHVLHLRPTYFFENLYYSLPMVEKLGMVGTPIHGDIKIPMIATKDIAENATMRLLNLDWSGHEIVELLGERDVSYNEIGKVLAEAFHDDKLHYEEVSYEAAKQGMLENGLSEDAAENMNQLAHAFNDGLIHTNEGRTPQNTSHTRIEEFMIELSHAV